MELLATVGAIGILLSVSIVVLSPLLADVRKVKLENNVAMINSAIDSYEAEGGDVTDCSTVAQVVGKLKSTAANKEIIAGYRGSYLDPRLDTEMQSTAEAAGGEWRALWDDSAKRLIVDNTGAVGVKRFYFNEDLVGTDFGTDERNVVNQLATKDEWIWDYDEPGPVASLAGSSTTTTEVGEPAAPTNPDELDQLYPPTFTPEGGLFEYFDFPSSLELTNPNDSSTTEIRYSLNGGAWQTYSSPIPVSPDDQVSAFVRPVTPDPGVFNSFTTTEFYQRETPSLSGTADGAFKDAVGASGMVTSIPAGDSDSDFSYGKALLTGGEQNRLSFTGQAFTDINPDQRFSIGLLTYLNSTTEIGTSAYEVTLQIDLNFSAPSATESVNVALALESTKNYPWLTEDQKADYVRFGQLHSDFSTFFNGETYYLNLEFAYSGTEGYSAIDSFHVHEGKTATAEVVGYFSQTPQDRPDVSGGSSGGSTPPPPSLP